MKILLLITTFISFTVPGVLLAEDVGHSQLTEAIKAVSGMEKNLQSAETIRPDCSSCKTVEPDKKLELKNKIEDLGTPLIYKDNVAYLIQVKRTKDSPLKSTLKFKNGHSECAKVFMGSNPFNGALIIECMINHTVYEEEELELNFKKLPLPADGEEQILELRIIKPKMNNTFYSIEAEILKGPSAKIEKDKKFWGSGYNLDFILKEERP